MTDLPQLAGPSDLAAAAQLVRRPVDLPAAAQQLRTSLADWQATAPADVVDESAHQPCACGAGVIVGGPGNEYRTELGGVSHGLTPCYRVEVVDQAAVENLEVLAADPCSCPAGYICAGSCEHCAALADDVPCPHDLDPPSPAEVELAYDTAAEQLAALAADDARRQAEARDQLQLAVGAGPTAAEVTAALRAGGPPVLLGPPPVVERRKPATAHLPTLDWRGRHDVRSLSYPVRTDRTPLQLADVMLPIGPVLDQGPEGACVGHAVVAAANVLDELAGDLDGHVLAGEDAHRLYQLAQTLDDRPGEGYDGTSVLAGMLAGRTAGLWTRFLWAFGTRDIAATIMRRRPVVIGIPWLSGMFDTAAGGRVELVGDDIGIGHSLTIVGLRMAGPNGEPGPWFVWQNSVGTDYGDGGLGYVHHRDLARLLRSKGEAAVPLPIGATS